jgi:hypothetical protein
VHGIGGWRGESSNRTKELHSAARSTGTSGSANDRSVVSFFTESEELYFKLEVVKRKVLQLPNQGNFELLTSGTPSRGLARKKLWFRHDSAFSKINIISQ